MDASTAVWLGLTLAAPLTLVPEIALLRLLHSRRSSWHPLDVLLVSLVVGQLCCTLVALGLSAAALARHAGLPLGHADAPHHGEAPLCAALVSFWAAAHTLHAATLTSMAVDRAMTVRWPYKYRLSVRRTQVRYHVVVLAVVSVLVGVAALFASTGGRPAALLAATPPPRPSVVEEIDETSTTDLANGTEAAAATMAPERQMMDPLDLSCTFLPHLFDSRFSYFWMCLHGLLLAGALSAGAVVLVTRVVASCCSGDLLGLAAGSGSDMRTLGHASDGSSATLPLPGPARYTPGPCLGGSSVSPAARSAKPMFGSPDKSFPAHQHEESAPKKADPAPGRRWNRQRHSTVAAVLVVAYLTHHLPLMVLTTLGTFFGHVLPGDWPYSAMVLASSLGSSLLVMAVLVVIDPSVHGWMMESLSPARHRRRPFPLDRHHHHHHHRRGSTGESAEQNLAPMKIDDEARYRISQIYSSEPAEAKFPLTNGSLFVHLMNPPSADSSAARANRRPSRMGVSAYDQRHQRGSNATTLASQSTHSSVYLESKPPLLTFMSRSKILSLNGLSAEAARAEPLYNDPGELQPADEAMNAALVSSLAGSAASTVAAGAKFLRNQEPIYASLSETVSSCNTLDSLGARILGEALERDEAQAKALAREARERRQRRADDSEDSDGSDVGSATESAGDDFEFHNIRTSRQTLISSPDEAARPRSRVARSATYRVLCNGLDVKCARRGEESAPGDGTVPSKVVGKGVVASESQHGLVTCVTIQANDESSLAVRSSLRASKLLTSLSMNDIDIIGSEGEPAEERDEFSGPVRSDSLFSLCDDRNRSPQGHSELELSKLPLDGRRPRKPQRPSIQQHLEQLERHRERQSSHTRKKSSRRSRAAVLQRFQDRNQSDSGFSTRSSTCNGTPTGAAHAKTVVSMAALKAALSQSPPSYLDNGDVYPSQSKTVFVSEYI